MFPVADEGTGWVRGWSTPEAKVLLRDGAARRERRLMLADGEKILFLRGCRHAFTIVEHDEHDLSSIAAEPHSLLRGCRSRTRIASVSPNGGGVVPADLGEVNLADEGTRWVRGWDPAACDALLAANKLRRATMPLSKLLERGDKITAVVAAWNGEVVPSEIRAL